MKHLSIIFALLFISFPSFADFSSSQCSSLHAGDDFSVWFKLAPSSGEDTIYATKRNGGSPTPIWSNDSSVQSPVIDDNETSNGEFYEVWLEYQSVTNKSGWLTYNLWEGSSWRQVGSPQYADLSGLSAAIAVSGDGASEIKCDDDITQPPPSYAPQALYQFGAMQCNGSECKIPLNKPFTNTPLVFVMPTIDPSNPDSDAPATLVVTNVTKTEATIEQIKAPKNGGGSNLTSQPMTEVSYLAIEPGVADFNGHEVIAGYLDTNRYKSKNGINGNAESVAYSTFGAQQAFNSPVVLHQLQTRNNVGRWVTSGKLIGGNDNNEARLFLELSASRVGNNYQEERVGFIATNSTSGSILEVDGYKVQFTRGYETPSQNGSDPMLDGCEDKYATTSLTNIDGVIANKQERAGGHGGWLRRCNINSNQVSFAVDEDFRDRTHIPEEVGYFAFERVTLPIEKCDYFPEMLQSNRYRPSSNPGEWIPWDGTLNISSGNGSGNNIYLNQLSKSEAVGFTYSNVSGVGACEYKDGQNGDGSCTVSATKNLFPSGAPDTPTFSASGGDLIAAGNNQSTLATQYKYTSLSFSPNTSTVILPAGEYWIDTINFDHNDSYIKVEGDGPVVIHYNHINFFQKSRIYINAGMNNQSDPDSNYDHNKLTFIGHGALSAFWPQNGSDIRLNANVYIPPEAASTGFDVNNVARFQMTGAITAPRVTFRARDTSYIKAQGLAGCYTPTEPTIKYIEIEPNNYHLTCDDTAQIYVTPYDDNDQAMGNVDGETVSLSALGVTFSNGSFDSQNKRFVFDIDSRDSNQYGAIPVTANVVGSAIEDTSDLIFVPLKFEVNNEKFIELIAGQQKGSIPIKALACDNAGKPISLGYSVDLNETNVTQTKFIPNSGNSAPLKLDASVTNGEGNISIKFDESGLFEGDLKAPISCDDFPNAQDCPENTTKEVVGKIKFKARPWTFAVCPPSGATTGGDASAGDGFIAAGETFSLYVKPIIWDASLDVIDSDSNQPKRLVQKKEPVGNPFCSLDVTTNFFKSDSTLNTTVNLSNSLATPSGGELGEAYTGSIGNISPSSELEFTDISVSEVGSFHFTASTSNAFYDGIHGGIDNGAREIGRFYPKYFQTSGSPSWGYPNGRFAYMYQPFSNVMFEVEALNNFGDPVLNYGHSSYMKNVTFSLFENSGNSERLHSPAFSGDWNNATGRSIGTFSWSNSGTTDCSIAFCWDKLPGGINYEDGPFNNSGNFESNISITGTASPDPIAYRQPSEQLLTTQPEIRFGRIKLEAAGGNTLEKIAIPLKIEFWNGSRFEVENLDSATQVLGVESEGDVTIWVEDGGTASNVSLSEGGQVSAGQSVSIIATQAAAVRQQTQVWLDLGSPNNLPWLRYAWENDNATDYDGEQDPSTVVTFGIYRGNDRVIYRGESGLTGQ
ncbi:DUF6701 domain-containing protein [Vibrio splendidus]|uniref:DUF6701 domain-containing protein n=1 Tax=Vibrio splendidus TaxID=29497 RepID=UPI0000670816|nr:DUF6701 domain-containing protein [Vibrio splendidus]EAP92146.1 MSHA biogenesis protein MshQ [Vibrio splendidus 12B01]